MLHEDFTGQKVLISAEKHMMMGTGKSFFHEEWVSENVSEFFQSPNRGFGAKGSIC